MPIRKESAGARYLREHYNEVTKKYPKEWVAVGATGVIAHSHDVLKITSANDAGVAFAYIKPEMALT